MRNLANQAALSPEFRRHIYLAAREAGLRELHQDTSLTTLLNVLFSDYVYIHDPWVEYYIRPENFPALPFGDCDDGALYSAAVLTALRIPNEFIFVYRKGQLQHVFTRAFIGDRQTDFDYAKIGA